MLSLSLLLSGCATLQLPEYEAQRIDHYSYSQVKDGLAVAIHPLTDKDENKQYFGTNLLTANVLAILIVAENRSLSSSFILSKDRFSLRAGEIAASSASGREQLKSESGGQAMALAGAALISLPLMFAGTKMASNANVVQHNFAVKELQTTTLSPGEKTHGFVYFRLPEENGASDQWVVHVEASNLRSKDVKSFDIGFAWKKE